MTVTLAIALLLQAAAPPFDPDGVRWEPLPAGPTVRTEYDPASVRRDGDRVRVTVRSAPVTNPGGDKLVALMLIDCPSHALGILTLHTYSSSGVHLRSQEFAAERIGLIPASGGGTDELIEHACRPAAQP